MSAHNNWFGLDDELEMVRQFHKKFDLIVAEVPSHISERKLGQRAGFLAEEVTEFARAAEAQDIVKMFDALLDIVYVAKGTATMLGLRHAWKAGFTRVHNANMAKVGGMTHRGHGKDVMKPEGWIPPENDLATIIRQVGYDPGKWRAAGEVQDSMCLDDERAG